MPHMPAHRVDDVAPRVSTRVRLVRVASLAVVAASLVGLIVSGLQLPGAEAAGDDSSLTVKWTGDSGAAQPFQPARSTASPHYNDFKDVQITVSQTTNIGDQAVRVNVTGLAPTVTAKDGDGAQWTTAQNFMQAMQCWGDPSAADFRTTCQWGGRYAPNNGLGQSIYRDNVLRVPESSFRPDAANAVDVPFKLYSSSGAGTPITGRGVWALDSNGQPTREVDYPLLTYMNPATTNEVQGARISAGSTSFDFETQSSDQAPQLGCGKEGHLRCWLVLVPRGSHYGGHDPSCSAITDNQFNYYSYGRPNSIQGGSPLNTQCDYWDNRMVVPLDFTPTGITCPSGNAERAVIGSQMLIGAMASWQPALCNKVGATFNFSANPDTVARLQLLDGDAGLAFGSFPLVKSELGDPIAEAEFDQTQVSYAPVAIGAAAFAFFAEAPDGRIDELHLTPRLVAKLLTQSYVFGVPTSSAEPAKNFAHLGAVNRSYLHITDDPDFRAANPDNWQRFNVNPDIVMPGPASADAIKQVWAWVLADSEARDFLAGNPDPSGMTINPYYLPKGHPHAEVPVFDENGDPVMEGVNQKMKPVGLSNIDTTPMKLSETLLDRFMKVDESLVPLKITVPNQTRFDSLQAFPYVDTFENGARLAFRADAGGKTQWDPTRVNAAGDIGDWVSAGAQVPGQRFTIAITDLASVERFNLSTASLRLDNRSDYADATLDGLTQSLTFLKPTSVAAVKQVDPATVTSGYPLTTVVYAAVNLTKSDATARRNFGALLREITTTGQVPGTAIGKLPAGYLPLTDALAAQASAAAAAIESYVAPTPSPSPSNGVAQDDYSGSSGGGDGATGGDGSTGGPEVTPVDAASDDRTPEPVAAPIARVGLAGALGFGVLGAVFAPLLFRGRGAL